MHMLRLMGIPVVQAPGEAEAQCSYMSKKGKIDAVCTEDTAPVIIMANCNEIITRNFYLSQNRVVILVN